MCINYLARNLNVQLAEAMLLQVRSSVIFSRRSFCYSPRILFEKIKYSCEQHLQWRQLNNVDGIQQENWSDMETDFPYHMNTYDLQGQPGTPVKCDVNFNNIKKCV